jgi:HEAT repeat protein
MSLVLAGGAAGSARLSSVSADALSELIQEVEESESSDPDRTNVLALLARDERARVRARVAEALGSLWPAPRQPAAAALRELSRDASPEVRFAASIGLARAIQRAAPVDRIELVSQWALSDNSAERAAIARALAHPVPVFMLDLVIEHLSGDAEPEVREAIARAAGAHFHQAPATYTRIASLLQADPDASVRSAARNLSSRVS